VVDTEVVAAVDTEVVAVMDTSSLGVHRFYSKPILFSSSHCFSCG
jgi:hypothetical protein